MIRFLCTRCGATLSRDNESVGATGACPHCGQSYIVPQTGLAAPGFVPPIYAPPAVSQLETLPVATAKPAKRWFEKDSVAFLAAGILFLAGVVLSLSGETLLALGLNQTLLVVAVNALIQGPILAVIGTLAHLIATRRQTRHARGIGTLGWVVAFLFPPLCLAVAIMAILDKKKRY